MSTGDPKLDWELAPFMDMLSVEMDEFTSEITDIVVEMDDRVIGQMSERGATEFQLQCAGTLLATTRVVQLVIVLLHALDTDDDAAMALAYRIAGLIPTGAERFVEARIADGGASFPETEGSA